MSKHKTSPLVKVVNNTKFGKAVDIIKELEKPATRVKCLLRLDRIRRNKNKQYE